MFKKLRMIVVYYNKNLLDIFYKAMLFYVVILIGVVVTQYQFPPGYKELMPFVFFTSMFTNNVINVTGLIIPIIICLTVKKQHKIAHIILQTILFWQLIIGIYLIPYSQYFMVAECVFIGNVFYFMESNRMKVKFHISTMGMMKRYISIIVTMLIVISSQYIIQFYSLEFLESNYKYARGFYNMSGISNNGKVFVGIDYHQELFSYDINKDGSLKAFKNFKLDNLDDNGYSVALSNKKNLIAIGKQIYKENDEIICIYDRNNESLTAQIFMDKNGVGNSKSEYYRECVYKLEFNDNDTYLLSVGTMGVEFWNLENKKLIKRYSETARDKAYWLKDNKYLRITDREAFIGDLVADTTEYKIATMDSFIAAKVSSDKSYIVLYDRDKLIFWDVEKKGMLAIKEFKEIFSTNSLNVDDIAISLDNKKLAIFVYEDDCENLRKEKAQLLYVIDLKNGATLQVLPIETKQFVREVKFIADDKVVAILGKGSGGKMAVYNLD